MVPPAPPLFSMTTVWPRLVVSAAPTARATVSVALPAVNGTMMWIVRDGQACAHAPRVALPARAATPPMVKSRRLMTHPPFVVATLPCRRDPRADAGDVQSRQDAFAGSRQPPPHATDVGPQ